MSFRPKILVVDDEPMMLDLLSEALAHVGAVPRCLQSSREAAEIINQEKFDGVFLDWLMPELDGLELARQVRWSKSNSLCPMVMVTGNTDPGAMSQCFRAGINFFLQKPAALQQIQLVAKHAWDLMLLERLRYQRVPLQVPVECTYALRSFEQHSKGHSVDLSTTGMRIRLDTSPDPGTVVQLSFSLPGDSKPFALTALVVRHSTQQRIGVRLINLTKEDRWRLIEFSKSAIDDTGPQA